MGSESKNGVGVLQVPQAVRTAVQSLKEIVNCPESEIYFVLKECNMDPNEAVQRLLTQDSFREVKSKRERRKEIKETQEPRSRVNCSGLARGPRSSVECNIGWSGSTQTNYNEFGSVAYKGENGFVVPPPHLTMDMTGKTLNQQSSSESNSLNTDSGRQSIGTGDFISTSVQPSSHSQSAWSGSSTGHLSMADVVRMGRRQINKGSQISSEASYAHQDGVTTNSYHCYVNSSQVSSPLQLELCHDLPSQNPSNDLEMFCQPGITASHNDSLDEWPVVEQPTAASGSSFLETSVTSASTMYSNLCNFHGNESNMSRNHHSHDGQVSEGDFNGKRRSSDHIDSVSASASSEQKFVTNAVEPSYCDEDFHQYSSSFDSHKPSYKYEEASGSGCGSNLSIKNLSVCSADNVSVAVSSAAENLQCISLGKGDPEDNCTVVLPNHLKALAVDCSHLSFGTYKSGTSSSLASPRLSNPLKDDVEGASTAIDSLSSGHLKPRHRNPGYYGDDPLASLYKFHRATADSRNCDLAVPSQPELIKQDVPEATLGHEYIKPSVHDSKFENIERASSGLSFARADSKIGNIPPFQAGTAYLDSMPSDLQVPTIQSLRGSDYLHSQFHVTQSMPSRYSNAQPSISSSTVSLSEVLKPSTFSLSEPSSLLSQHRTANLYSEPTFPLEQLANMAGYPTPPQSYLHAPSTFQQAYPGGGIELDQSLDGMKYSLPQYNKSGASLGRLSASASSGYGGFVNSTNVPGVYLNSPSAASMLTTSGCNELHPQYKGSRRFNSFQQNNSSSTWNHHNLRTQLPVTDSAYYSLLGHNQQQHAGHRQGQQSSQHYGSLGYSNFYGSQTGITHGHQQPSLSDLTLGGTGTGTEDLSAQQLHQFWQHGY